VKSILTEKMNKARDMNQFELAIKFRDGIRFIDKLKERTVAQTAKDLNADVFGYYSSADVFCVSVLTVRGGKIIGISNYTSFDAAVDENADKLESFVAQYYLQNKKPDEIIISAKRGVKKRLLDTATANAKEYTETSVEKIKFKNDFTVGACSELGKILGMQNPPRKIECFDISHTDGEEQVASMTVFIDGIAERKLYRKFKIKHTEGNNDFLSMAEVIGRRLARLKSPDDSFGIAPDIIVIDGGKGQLSAVMEKANNMVIGGLEIVFISLAKQFEEIFTAKSNIPILLPRRSYALRLLQRIRDEAHRFAITFHRNLRGKKYMKSLLKSKHTK
jgi:excinuclease ABC subunit C